MIRRIPGELARASRPLSLPAQELRRWLDSHRQPREQPASFDIAAITRALRALVCEELALRPEHIRAIVERELTVVRRAAHIELQVHPDDRALLDDESALQNRLELTGQLTVISDPTMERGGCIVVSKLGELDARLTTRIQVAAELLRNGDFDGR